MKRKWRRVSACVKNWSVGIAADGGLDSGGVVATGDYDDVGTRQRRSRLAQTARGEEVATAEGICRVYEDNVHVAGELEVLETVVEDEPIYAVTG